MINLQILQCRIFEKFYYLICSPNLKNNKKSSMDKIEYMFNKAKGTLASERGEDNVNLAQFRAQGLISGFLKEFLLTFMKSALLCPCLPLLDLTRSVASSYPRSKI